MSDGREWILRYDHAPEGDVVGGCSSIVHHCLQPVVRSRPLLAGGGTMNRDEVLAALREAGYTGPTSRTKGQLEEILRGLLSRPERPAAGLPEPAPIVAETTNGGFQKASAWDGLDPTREFRVRGEPGAWFRFTALVTNPRTGEQWVDGVGGIKGHRKQRSFRLERVIRKGGTIVSRPTAKKPKKTEDEA